MPPRQGMPPGNKWVAGDVIKVLEESLSDIPDISYFARLGDTERERDAQKRAMDGVLCAIKALTLMMNDKVGEAQTVVDALKEKRRKDK